MILANLRERLTQADVDFVVRLLAAGDDARRRELERTASEGGVQELLDEPTLFSRLRQAPGIGAPSPELFLCVAVVETLRRAGISDALLSNYVAALLFEFGFRSRAYQIAQHDDQLYRYVADIIADIDQETGRRRFLLQVHLGNFTLWLAGVFPDHIAVRRERKGGPDLSYYEEMGARGFREAAASRLAQQLDMSQLYARAAETFPQLRVALNHLSDTLLFPRYASADRLLRHVSDESRFPPLTS
jgi:hypothetical protein